MSAAEYNNRVDPREPVGSGQFAGGVVVDYREEKTSWECGEEGRVLCACAEDSAPAQRPEQDCCCEVGLQAWAGESVLLVCFAEVGDTCDLEVHDARAHEGGYDCCKSKSECLQYIPSKEIKNKVRTCSNLTPEGLTRGDLEIVAEFQIISETEGVRCSHVSKALEEVHLDEYLSNWA